jgi:hypothetical protein
VQTQNYLQACGTETNETLKILTRPNSSSCCTSFARVLTPSFSFLVKMGVHHKTNDKMLWGLSKASVYTLLITLVFTMKIQFAGQ